jgi:hypothetical protein
MNANDKSAANAASTAVTRAALLANTNTVAGTIAPLSINSGNFSEPAEYAKAIDGFPMWKNTSTIVNSMASDPAAFPPGYFCPVGQGVDFIKKYRDLSPENPAATNIGGYWSVSPFPSARL